MGKQRERLPIIKDCVENEGCKYYPNCHLSTHHTWPQRLGHTALEKKFIHDERNKVRVCRAVHDLFDQIAPNTLPPRQYMKDFLDGK